MDDATLLARAHAGLRAQTRLLATHGGTLIEDDGWIACVMPQVPTASIVNCVVGVPDVDRIHAKYAQQGVEKWGVWLDSKDCEGARRLEEAGLVLDSVPVVMGAALEDLELDTAPDTQPVDLTTIGAINDRAYGHDDGRMERVIAAIPRHKVDPHALHDDDGEPAAVTFILDVEDDACVGWVATLSHARRKGLAGKVVTGALKQAQKRGQTSTTLWASAMGAPVYARLGYREVGHFHLWERRP